MKTILIVDPEFTAESTRDILVRHGYQVVVEYKAFPALARIQSGQPVDLVVTELHFPDMDGLDFVSALRRCNATLPVIIVTNLCSIECYLQATALGVVEYLNKPVLMKEFSNIVRYALTYPQPFTAPPEAQG